MKNRLPKNRLKPDAKKHIVNEFDEKEPVEKKQITGATIIRYVSAYYDNRKEMFMCFCVLSVILGLVFLFIFSWVTLLCLVLAAVFLYSYFKTREAAKDLKLQEFYIEKHPLKGKYSREEDDDGTKEYVYYFIFDGYRDFRIGWYPPRIRVEYDTERIYNSAKPGDGVYLLFWENKGAKILLALPETLYEFEYEDFREQEGRYYPIEQKAEERFEKERLKIQKELKLIKEKSVKNNLPPELKKLKRSENAFKVYAGFSIVAVAFTVIGIFSEFVGIFNPFVQPVWLIVPAVVSTVCLIISGSAVKKISLINDDRDEAIKKQKKLKRLNALLIIMDFFSYIAAWAVAFAFHTK